MRDRCAGAAAAFLAAMVGHGDALAAAPTPRDLGGVHLSLVRTPAASTCPDAAHVEADVARRLGVSPFSGPPRTSLEITVSKTDDVWKAEIEMRGMDGASTGSRTVTSEAATCASLAAAAGLAVALMINPDVLLAPDPQAAPVPSAEPVPQEPMAPPVEPPPHGRAGTLVLSAVAAAKVLPQISPGIELRGDIALSPRASASISGMLLPEQQASRTDGDVSFGITWATLGPCYKPVVTSTWEIDGCASLVVGAMHVVVATPTPDQVGQRLYWGATAGARLTFIPFRGWELLAQADAIAPFNRRTFVIEHDRPLRTATVFAQPAVGGLFSLGIGIRY